VELGRTVGKVKWFNDSKGFGFIAGECGQDIFVHQTAILHNGYRTLKEGDSVEYECEMGPKGPKALKVKKVTENERVLALV